MSPSDTALLASLLLAFSLVSKRIEGTVLTPPLIAVAFGLLLGPGLGWLKLDISEGALHLLAELTLIFVLFGDATRIDVRMLRRGLDTPARLLLAGLPLSIAAGAGLAKLVFPELGWWEAATVGAVLAPTDAALGQAVVASPVVPLRIRQALNVESGLNDGIALPFVLVFASFASMGHGGEGRSPEGWVLFAALQVTLGPLVGVLVGWLGGRWMHRASEAGFVEESFERLSGLALALLCFATAELVGGNGFIAAFVGGMTLGTTQKSRCKWMVQFLEAEGALLMFLVFLGLGSTLTVPTLFALSVPGLVYVGLSLTVARMVPVSLALLGSGLRASSHLFIGWFGPRGLATLLYAILIVSKAELPHEELVFTVAVATAIVSVLAHGLTASPLATLYGRSAANARDCPAEHAESPVVPIRRR